uniref:Ankyrin repeat-containing domain, PGG domain protein n=1 Tax=Tanacetum cinerariifolium TaxID=118510 RepID=A0A6L2LNF5_TANCI|nr:ankyrin repeat-containing domain, PGG domain protein [Tanacetum cinerariifolium]
MPVSWLLPPGTVIAAANTIVVISPAEMLHDSVVVFSDCSPSFTKFSCSLVNTISGVSKKNVVLSNTQELYGYNMDDEYPRTSEEQLLQITKHKTAKAIWDALKTRHIGEERVQQARLQTLKSDFEMLHMKEDETIYTFTRKLTALVNKAASLGHTIENQTLVRKLLNAMPDSYLQIVASIEQYSDLSEMTMKEAIRRLKTYEEIIKYNKGKQVDNQEKLMFTRHESKGKYFRGRRREKHRFSQGKSHKKFIEERKDGESSHRNFNRNNFKKSSYDTSKLQCYQCKKIWHIAPNCPQRTKANQQSNLVEEDLEPTLLMAILEDSNERNQVKEVEEQKVSLHEEDVGYKETNMDSLRYLDSGASNHMTGTIENELRTTLRMLRTDQGGEFTSSEFTQYCKENGITRQLTAPYSPQQIGVVERRNRTIMSTTRCMMKATNMPQNFWAEAVRHAIYILNSVPTKALDDITPYEAIKRVFGCIAYAKVPSQRLKMLDDRSSRMVYLGNEPGSKAYRLFDPTTQKICVSRDVKFKKNETWDWKEYMNPYVWGEYLPLESFTETKLDTLAFDAYKYSRSCVLAKASNGFNEPAIREDGSIILFGWIFGSASENVLDVVINLASAKDVWDQLKSFYDTTVSHQQDKSGYDIVQLAVINRLERIYNPIYDLGERKNLYRMIVDSSKNNILHLAGRLESSSKLNNRRGEEVKKVVFPTYITQDNIFLETLDIVFTREHENLVKDGEQSLKTTAESCSISAGLITAIVFAAAITVPGGSNQDTGIPLFTQDIAFAIFAVSDAISLFASSTALLVFLSILTSRFAERDFLISLPRRLLIGICTLLLSAISMMIASNATLVIVFGHQNPRLLAPICGSSLIPISFSLCHHSRS